MAGCNYSMRMPANSRSDPRADPFAKDWPRQQRHNQRHGEGNRHRFRQLQIQQRIKIQHGGGKQRQGAGVLQPEAIGFEQIGLRKRVGCQHRKQRRPKVARPNHLHHRKITTEPFGIGVEHRKKGIGGNNQRNAELPRRRRGRLGTCVSNQWIRLDGHFPSLPHGRLDIAGMPATCGDLRHGVHALDA